MPGLLPPFQTADPTPRPHIYCSKRPLPMHSASCPFPGQFTLRSPPIVQERCISVPCSPSPRRRVRGCLVSQQRRRWQQHRPSRVDYRPELPQLHAFDKLPWIASLDEPLADNVHLADLADLSLLRDPIRQSTFGPTRRRKSILRSTPLPFPTPTTTPTRNRANDSDDDDNHLFHHLDYNLFSRETLSRPSTPTSRRHLDPARVTFRHLMPVVSDHSDDDDDV